MGLKLIASGRREAGRKGGVDKARSACSYVDSERKVIMTWQQILVQTGIITGLLTLLGIIIKGRIIKKIEEFKKALEWETRKREQVAQIAELVSLWIEKEIFSSL